MSDVPPRRAPVTTADSELLAALVAQAAIRDAVYRFCRGVDRGDRELMLGVFHPDAVDSHGPGGPAVVVEDLLAKFDATPRVGQHHVTNVYIELHDDVAAVESYFIIFNAQSVERGGGHDLIGGRYLDRFERRAGDWRIARRDIVVDVARSDLAGLDIARSLPFLVGARRGDDRSSHLFD